MAAIIGPLASGIIAERIGLRNILFFAFLATCGSFAMSKGFARQTIVAQKMQD
ncbi:MAG: hypothetical protein QXX64_05830 [Nitrososphaera sp.]|uniref:Major facilitator superfamily (MFS) profile domain-containing protein n=1 Tax=Nitrososphaera gargensis (strain Ga9.2) TaxID=1237085 RepID=K0IAA9_NITGG|nr:hypothetical protein [Candidatus Nitrososphaera gargensis]AFU58256.1 hypothetical protein Ngar_c13180 [Candidatus Nitrososphaera gargensis Ga9.2]